MSEKTEEATSKKKRKSREDGQVARSAEFTGVAVMISAVAVMAIMGVSIAQQLGGLCAQAIELAARPDLDPSVTGPFLMDGLRALAIILAPLLGVTFVIAAFISYLQVGALFTIKALIPDSKRIDPIKGAKNIFSKAKAVELVKNVAKLSLMGAVGYAVLRANIAPVLMTPRLELTTALAVFLAAALELSLYLVGGLIGFGVFDLLWQRYKHGKDLRMSKDEVKREYKDSEGDPMMKGQRRRMHKELASAAGAVRVKDADAVVVNPTHVAVALRYREAEMHAPVVVAAGRGDAALEIKRLARRYQIPIVHNVDLARALVEVGVEDEIPENFYEAVAEVLRFVYALRKEEQ
ncbi:MAG: EscU/YscU/HrcU family type III secretion system export apparatus switch protein [Bradymonadaceae bacterium]|nr:EscU/YscU/HrcU family type III secretion system export apparatus switch protein [Lujinxingiaceae bacterium]